MKNNLMVIDERVVLGKEFRIYGDFENPLFLAKDVKEWIEHNNITLMLNSIDEEEKLTYVIHNSGQNREMWFLTEDGLYEVLMLSKKPIAKKFKKQVKAVLKQIRTTGSYIPVVKQDSYVIEDPIARAKRWIEEEETRILLEAKVQEVEEVIRVQAPKVQKYNKFLEADGTMSVENFAKAFSVKDGNKKIGRNSMFKLLKEMKVLTKDNAPTQAYLNRGYFEVVFKKLVTGELVTVTRVTPLGADRLMDMVNKHLAEKARVKASIR